MEDINRDASLASDFAEGQKIVRERLLQFGVELARSSGDSYSIKLQEKMALALGITGL
ncbi:hypothetical protein [Acetobacter cibinongensis]|uniref:hypothetical protein n=1 Tax=Acetobacter cibinongensis TaxID=146475 RepID=UPI0013FE488B|nr:hypothetical protein [Acetobacter cibinongensis]